MRLIPIAFSEKPDGHVYYLSNFAEELNVAAASVQNLHGWIIRGVECFAAGTYGGVTYTEQDLTDMEANFRKLKGQLDPPLKVDHSESAKDQVGWILDIRKSGQLLLADLHVTEWRAFDKITNGTWKKVSSEIYTPEAARAEFGESADGYVFRALAIVSIPKVKTIKGLGGIVLNAERWGDDPEDQDGGGNNNVDKLKQMIQKLSEMGITLTDEQQARILAGKAEEFAHLFAEPKPAPAQPAPGTPAPVAGTPAAAIPAATGQPIVLNGEQHFLISSSQIVALAETMQGQNTNVTDLASQVANLTQNAKKTELQTWFSEQMKQGKVTPAEKETIMAFAESLEGDALANYKKTIEARAAVVKLGEGEGRQEMDDEGDDDKTTHKFNEQGQRLFD